MKKYDLIESALYDNLPYRLDLSISKPFGLEIEAGLLNGMDRYFICNDEFLRKDFKRNTDSSVGGDFPLEIQTPLLLANKDTWFTLKILSERMKRCKIDFSRSAFQVNMDVSYSYNDIYNFLLFFRTYEHILFKFSTSFRYILREDMSRAVSLGEYFKYTKNKIMEETNFSTLVFNKNYAISFKYKDNSSAGSPPNIVEFRSPNGCDDAWIWQNYINTFYHFCEYILYIDKSEIDSSLCAGESQSYRYDKLWLDDAVYFADLIFTDDVDKVYFLKQYIGPDVMDAKNFIKRRKLV